MSVTLETFQDLSLPIPGKEDLAKLHSSSHPTSIVKAGSCGEAYAPQGWIAFFMEYVKRYVCIFFVISSLFKLLFLLYWQNISFLFSVNDVSGLLSHVSLAGFGVQ